MTAPDRPSMPVWYSIVVVVVSLLAMTVVSLVVADRAARQSEQRWCGLISTMDDAYRASPPQTPVGQRLARDIAELRGQFHCD